MAATRPGGKIVLIGSGWVNFHLNLVLQKLERKVVWVLNGSLLAENAGYCKFVNGEHS